MTDDPKDRPELETGDDPLAADLAAADPGPVDPELDPEAGREASALDLDAAVGSSDREAGGEAAEDLNASELEAAARAAENEVDSEEARAALDAEIAGAEAANQPIEGDETEGDETDETDETETPIEAAPALAPGTGALERPVAKPVTRPGARTPRGPKPARTVFAVDPALRIKDPVSAALVVGTVLVFVLILANALAFGHGGAFHPLATPTPIATEAPSAVPSAGPSSSPGASGSPPASPSIAPSASPSVAPSPAAS